MKTRFTPLFLMKKNRLEQCERDLARANTNLHNAQNAVEEAYIALKELQNIMSGTIQEMLAQRAVLEIRRRNLDEKREWEAFAAKEVKSFEKLMQQAYIEYEKYKYLETKEIERIVKERNKKEAKQFDESALQSYMYRQEKQ